MAAYLIISGSRRRRRYVSCNGSVYPWEWIPEDQYAKKNGVEPRKGVIATHKNLETGEVRVYDVDCDSLLRRKTPAIENGEEDVVTKVYKDMYNNYCAPFEQPRSSRLPPAPAADASVGIRTKIRELVHSTFCGPFERSTPPKDGVVVQSLQKKGKEGGIYAPTIWELACTALGGPSHPTPS